MLRCNVMTEVEEERDRQDKKWGENRRHSHIFWLAILMEEVGEVARAIIDGSPSLKIRNELIQVAAVCFCWIENWELVGTGKD